MKRRDFLKGSLVTAILASLGRYATCRAASVSPLNPFRKPLVIPPLLTSANTGSDFSPLKLSVNKGHHSFLPDLKTETLGYNGTFLGPTIRVNNGERVRLHIDNTLEEHTTVHWHGLHVPAVWDGGPRQIIEPGELWTPEFRIKQQAATLWYHPHAMGSTGEQVYRGLAGLFIIDDALSTNLPLPAEYGIDDLPIILQDRRFFEDGSFAYIHSMHDVMHGVQGNFLLVNGMLQPYVEVPGGVVRFRFLNGSNSSIYRLRLSTGDPLFAIASDGGFLTRPVQLSNIILSAGERMEILIDLSGNRRDQKLHLLVDQFNGQTHDALELRVTDRPAEIRAMPRFLRDQAPLVAASADNTRFFTMETVSDGGGMGRNRLTINGKKMALNRIDEQIPLNSTEIWEITNTSASMMQLPHSMHLHDVQFNILERNGGIPHAVEAGRKDTVLLWPGDRIKIIARFEDYTGIYMYHCHMLEHEDDGMMGQFEIVPAKT